MGCKKCNTNKCTCEVTTCINPLIYMMKGVFSLVGTDSANIGILEYLTSISKDGGNATPFPKTPVNAAMDKAGFTLDLTTALIETLMQGVSISNNKNICCPDCKNGIYFLGGGASFSNLYSSISNSKTRICCLEHAASIPAWLRLKENIGTDFACCDTDFNEAFELWVAASSSSSAYFYLDDILANGVFESSSFNGYSGLGILFNYLQLSHPELTSEDYLNILGVIVNLGFVIQCNGCELVMASTDQYVKWWSTNNN